MYTYFLTYRVSFLKYSIFKQVILTTTIPTIEKGKFIYDKEKLKLYVSNKKTCKTCAKLEIYTNLIPFKSQYM